MIRALRLAMYKGRNTNNYKLYEKKSISSVTKGNMKII